MCALRFCTDLGSRMSEIRVVGIGASAGGMKPLEELIASVSPRLGLAFVLVQHSVPASMVLARLERVTDIPVSVVRSGDVLAANRVYVAPPATLLHLEGDTFGFRRSSLRLCPSHCVDYFFRSLARTLGERAIGIVLSGAISDGADGVRAIYDAHGVTFAQDESAEFINMPGRCIATGCVNYVLSPRAIAKELHRLSSQEFQCMESKVSHHRAASSSPL